jgi:nicotinate dehydrogenase subunit B
MLEFGIEKLFRDAQGQVTAAIGNAASRALGVRLRDLPLTRDRLVSLLLLT